MPAGTRIEMDVMHVAIRGHDAKLIQPLAAMLLQLLADDLALENRAHFGEDLFEGSGVTALYRRPCTFLANLAIEIAGEMVAVADLPGGGRHGDKQTEHGQWQLLHTRLLPEATCI
jgi:hypothetical protein